MPKKTPRRSKSYQKGNSKKRKSGKKKGMNLRRRSQINNGNGLKKPNFNGHPGLLRTDEEKMYIAKQVKNDEKKRNGHQEQVLMVRKDIEHNNELIQKEENEKKEIPMEEEITIMKDVNRNNEASKKEGIEEDSVTEIDIRGLEEEMKISNKKFVFFTF